MKKPKKLRKLLIDRIDLVDRPANQEARIMLFKRAPDAGEAPFAYLRERFEKISKILGQEEKGEKMETIEKKIETIAKQILAGEVKTKEQVWRAIEQLLDAHMKAEDERRFRARIDPVTGIARLNVDQPPSLTREQLLMQILATPQGKQLHSLYDALPHEKSPVPLNKTEQPTSPAWDRIEKAAAQLVSEGKAKTRQQAVAQAIEARPELFLEYASERLG